MSRLNELIHSNTGLHQKLANENYALETEFVEELKEMEQESVKMESEIKILKDQKKELLQDIIESERQLLLWEKKIQLEKETQETLDPSVGVSEGAAMEREIHRMRLRYEAIKRDQDRMVNEMERAVMKREVIAQKYKKNPSVSKYKKRRERASRNGSTVVSIFIPPPSFKPVSLSLPRISSILKHPNKSFF